MVSERVATRRVPRGALGHWINRVVGIVIIGGLSVLFTISFAALVYTGPLSPLLAQGIGLSLASAVILGLVGLATYSFRGTICQPQDITAVLLGSAAVAIAAERSTTEIENLLPTIAALCMVSMLVAGAVSLLLGAVRLGGLARYIPFPVISGYLAATGYLLVLAALSIPMGESVDLWSLALTVQGDAPVRWGPWLLGGLGMALFLRRSKSDLALPLCLVAAAGAFYASLPVLGVTLSEMRAEGYLLGPFGDSFLGGLGTQIPGPVEWPAILGQVAIIAAVAGMTVLGAVLKSTGLEFAVGGEIDLDKDLRATGWSNLLAGPTGGLPGHSVFATTVLAHRLRLGGRLPGIVNVVASALVLAFGAAPLSFVPAGLVALTAAFLGFDMLLTWLYWEGRKLLLHEYLVVLAIVAVAATVGFLEALGVGLVVAVAIFVVAYARTDFVRVRSTVASRRSRVERSEAASAHLACVGQRAAILELDGYLFFGSGYRLLERVRRELTEGPAPTHVVIDFGHVTGIDASAMLSLGRIVGHCRAAGATCVFSGLSLGLQRHLERAMSSSRANSLSSTLDAALESVEEDLLLLRDEAEASGADEAGLLALSEALGRSERTRDAVQRIEVAAGEELLRRGSESHEVYVLVSGTMCAEVSRNGGERLRVASFQPGALIGEIAYYASTPRTAWVVATTSAELLRIDLDLLEQSDRTAASRFHRQAAKSLALRVKRMTQLLAEAGL